MNDDDWMNPPRSLYQTPKRPPYGTKRYIIEREKRAITFGYPGSITEWHIWSTHDNAKDRDDAYAKLIKDHSWSIRTRNQWYGPNGWEYLGHWVNDE